MKTMTEQQRLDEQIYVKLGTDEQRMAKDLPWAIRRLLEEYDEPVVNGWTHRDGASQCNACELWESADRQRHECMSCSQMTCDDCIDEVTGECRLCRENRR